MPLGHLRISREAVRNEQIEAAAAVFRRGAPKETPMPTPTCPGPALDDRGRETTCGREVRSEGMCFAHYRQAVRCRERGQPVVLKPLRQLGSPREPLRLRVAGSARKALEAEGTRRSPPVSGAEVARAVLEDWARARRPKRRRRK